MMIDITIDSAINEDMPRIKLFWTGGFDSTFRMIQLSRFNVIVQPYYLADYQHRNSIKNELEAIKVISEDIKNHPETKFVMKPLIIVDVKDIGSDEIIKASHQRLFQEIALGSQYEWLAVFAKNHQGVELSLEKGRLQKYFETVAAFSKHSVGGVSFQVIDKERSSEDVVNIFGNFHFPYPVSELTKLEIVEEYKRLGFGEIISKTWFCHNPVKNEPCGVCTPCRQIVEKGMSFRISPSGMKRYKTDQKYRKKVWFIFFKKIRLKVCGY